MTDRPDDGAGGAGGAWLSAGQVLDALPVLSDEQFQILENLQKSREALAHAQKKDREGYETGYRKGHETGSKDGYEQGHAYGVMAGRQALDELGATWRRIGEMFESRLNELLAGQQPLLLDYATVMAEAFLRERLRDPDAMRRQLGNLQSDQGGKRCLNVTTHPQNLDAVRRAAAEIPGLTGAAVEADRKLQVGDLVLTYERQVADGRVASMIGAVASVLLEKVLSPGKSV